MKNSKPKQGRQNGVSRGDPSLLDNTVFYDRNPKELRGYLVSHNHKIYEVSLNKVIVSKNLVEVFNYEKPVILNRTKNYRTHLNDSPERKTEREAEKAKRREEYKKRAVITGINNIKRLVDCNFSVERSKFITLTFNDKNNFDIKNLSETHQEFKKFIQRLKRYYLKLKYVAVPEFQDKNGRGAVHYHMICNIPYTPKEKIADIWQYGFISIKDIKMVNSVGAYLAKYMSKNASDPRYDKNKKVLRSKYLDKPNILYGEKADAFLTKHNLYETPPNHVSSYSHEMSGKITVSNFNLRKLNPTQDNKNAGN